MVRLTDETFHVYNRGVNRQVIYQTNDMFRRFLDLINEFYNPKELFINAFCLMPNHFHLLIKQIKAFGISSLMERVCGDFARIVNHSLVRSGHLLEGRYKMKVARHDDSPILLARYIHLNPCKAGLVAKPDDWQYSSIGSYLGKPGQPFLSTEQLLSQLDLERGHRLFFAGPAENDPTLPRHLLFRE
jgi:REP element-mobilizing transposase RayT